MRNHRRMKEKSCKLFLQSQVAGHNARRLCTMLSNIVLVIYSIEGEESNENVSGCLDVSIHVDSTRGTFERLFRSKFVVDLAAVPARL